MAQGLFRQKEIFRNPALLLISQHKARGGKNEGRGNSYPGDGNLLRRDAPAHEKNQQRYENRQRLRNNDGAKARLNCGAKGLFRAIPRSGDQSGKQIRRAPDDIRRCRAGAGCEGNDKKALSEAQATRKRAAILPKKLRIERSDTVAARIRKPAASATSRNNCR